jgi:hypothetical protein
MAWNDEADRREQQRRIDAAIGRASACHMSDAKWRKLFLTLRAAGVGRMTWKFVRSDQLSYEEPPPEWALMESCIGDFGVAPGVPYREIDWVEVRTDQAAGAREALAGVGEFRTERHDSGLRILGYSW